MTLGPGEIVMLQHHLAPRATTMYCMKQKDSYPILDLMDHKTPIISNGAVASDDKFVDDPDDS